MSHANTGHIQTPALVVKMVQYSPMTNAPDII